MALLTDGPPASLELLQAYESSILDVAHTEGINLETKLNLACAEASDRVLTFLLEQSSATDADARRAAGVTGVVITPPLRRWHAQLTLLMVFEDAYGGQRNERYQEKVQQYTAAADAAQTEYLRLGVGMVRNPVPVAGQPVINASGIDGITCFVAITRVNAAGAEGQPGEIIPAILNPGAEVSSPEWSNAAYPYWNVYVGLDRRSLTLQNASPLPLSNPWTYMGLQSGPAMTSGQAPDYYVVFQQNLSRG